MIALFKINTSKQKSSVNPDLFNECSYVLVQSPLWCCAIIGIILIYCYDFIIFHLNKGRYMKRNTFIFRIDLCNSNNQIIYHFYPLNNSIPFPRVLTICNNILIYCKMFISTMPIYIDIFMKVFSDFLLILGQNGFPKLFYIHVAMSLLTVPASENLNLHILFYFNLFSLMFSVHF